MSIRGKIIFFITLVMVLTTVGNIYFANRDVGQAMRMAQEESAQNILYSLDLIIKDDYHNLLSEKSAMTLLKRQQLKDAAMMIRSVFKGYAESRSGGPPDVHQALEWLENAPFNHVDTLVIDRNNQVLSSSSPTITSDTYRHLTDIKQRNISSVMNVDSLQKKGDFAAYIDKRGLDENKSVLSFFLPFEPWGLTIAASVDISNIEAQANREKERIIQSLQEYAGQLAVARQGFVYMFDSRDNILIGPPEYIASTIFQSTNALTGRPIHEEIRDNSVKGISTLRYVAGTDRQDAVQVVYCSYFKPLQWYTGVIVPEREISRPARELMIRQSLIIGLMFMIGIVAVFILVTRIANPLNLLSSYARKLPEQDFTKPLPETTPIDTLAEKYRDEVGYLATSFLLMRQELGRNIQNLVEITASRERIESELSIAREIQLGMVPKTFPSFPEHNEFDLYATLQPAKEIGGDLYDFFLIDDSRLCFTLGDVSDKGIPSALLMVVTRTLIRTLGEKVHSPARIMESINNIISADNPRSMFVTLVIGVFNIDTGEIVYANGGHNPPVVIQGNRAAFFKKEKNEPLVGAFPGMTYTDRSLVLSPQDSFFLYTDGVNEAMDINGEQYSNERLVSQVEDNRDKTVHEAIENILASIRDHAGDAQQSDDIAMLMIKYYGKRT